MGGAIVTSLLRAGRAPLVFDVAPAAVATLVDQGAAGASSLEDLARRADLVGVCVANDAQVRSVVEGLLEHLAPGSVVSLHSTVLPETATWAAAAAGERGVGFVEAPVTGGPAAAAEGRLTFLLGGHDAHVAALGPLLDACADRRVRVDEVGQANLLKLCINLQTYVTHVAVNEAASLATQLGLPLEALKTAMEGNGQLGELTRNYLVLHELPQEVLDDPATLALREPLMAVIAKDLQLIRQVAAGIGKPVPGAELAARQLGDTYLLPDWQAEGVAHE